MQSEVKSNSTAERGVRMIERLYAALLTSTYMIAMAKLVSKKITGELARKADSRKAAVFKGFFKSDPPGGLGESFIGVTVPKQRDIARAFFREARLYDIRSLLKSPVHEHRFTALEILVMKYEHAESYAERRSYFNFYLRNSRNINNWDLVDTSAEYIVGDFLFGAGDDTLLKLAESRNKWERRMAAVATFAFIKRGRFDATLRIAHMLLGDKEDLVQKAAGWMLREVGKREMRILKRFLDAHAGVMPRTMLRYSIERLSETDRRRYMEQHG